MFIRKCLLKSLVVVENLYNRLWNLLEAELDDLSIGYSYNKSRFIEMSELLYAIYFIEANATSKEDGERALHYFM